MFELLVGQIGLGEETDVHIKGLIEEPRFLEPEWAKSQLCMYIINSPSQTHWM